MKGERTMTEPKKFHLADILSITDGRLIAATHMGAIYKILSFMTGESLMENHECDFNTHQLGRAGKACAPVLLARYPVLGTPEMKFEIDCLCEFIKIAEKKDHECLILGWEVKTAAKFKVFGIDTEMDVYPISEGYEKKDSLQEFVEMRGGTEEILVVKT